MCQNGRSLFSLKGGFAKAKRREIDDTTISRSDVIGIASIQQAVQDEQGDIFDPLERGIIRWEQLIEIGPNAFPVDSAAFSRAQDVGVL